jgi:hypothetical protein
MVYIDRYLHIYKFKYVYVHIRVRQQSQHMVKSKTTKKRHETLQSRLVLPTETKGGGRRRWGDTPWSSLGSYYETGLRASPTI